jgi:hypothetical protein
MQHTGLNSRYKQAVRLFVLAPIDAPAERARLRADYYLEGMSESQSMFCLAKDPCALGLTEEAYTAGAGEDTTYCFELLVVLDVSHEQLAARRGRLSGRKVRGQGGLSGPLGCDREQWIDERANTSALRSRCPRGNQFEAGKVDGFVQSIREWSPRITRAQFNGVMRNNQRVVKRYKLAFEAKDSTNQLNPFTVIRHCLYLSDKTTFSKALTKLARESFETWLAANPPAITS